MSKVEHRPPEWLDDALGDPGSIFTSPEEVVRSPELTLEEKVRVLRSWEYDAAQLAVAEEEGMRGPQNGRLQRILLALSSLTEGNPPSSVLRPTGQEKPDG